MTTARDALPPWMLPSRPSGWEADDLDNAPDLPRHTELIDGALIFMVSSQRSPGSRTVDPRDNGGLGSAYAEKPARPLH